VARSVEQELRWAKVGLVFVCCVLLGAAGREEPDLTASGFVARAQRAELVVVGRVASVSVGVLGGCGHKIAVERVLRGTVDGDRLSLRSPAFTSDCAPLPFHHRLVMAFDENPNESAFTEGNYPPGRSWWVVLGGDDTAYGDLTRCYGATVDENLGTATNAPEHMPLQDLVARLSEPARRPCRAVEPDPALAPRMLEGQVQDAFGSETWAQLELVPVGRPDSTTSVSTDERGRFRLSDVPGGPVWLRSPDDDFDAFLLPPGVDQVRVVIPWFSPRSRISLR